MGHQPVASLHTPVSHATTRLRQVRLSSTLRVVHAASDHLAPACAVGIVPGDALSCHGIHAQRVPLATRCRLNVGIGFEVN